MGLVCRHDDGGDLPKDWGNYSDSPLFVVFFFFTLSLSSLRSVCVREAFREQVLPTLHVHAVVRFTSTLFSGGAYFRCRE